MAATPGRAADPGILERRRSCTAHLYASRVRELLHRSSDTNRSNGELLEVSASRRNEPVHGLELNIEGANKAD